MFLPFQNHRTTATNRHSIMGRRGTDEGNGNGGGGGGGSSHGAHRTTPSLGTIDEGSLGFSKGSAGPEKAPPFVAREPYHSRVKSDSAAVRGVVEAAPPSAAGDFGFVPLSLDGAGGGGVVPPPPASSGREDSPRNLGVFDAGGGSGDDHPLTPNRGGSRARKKSDHPLLASGGGGGGTGADDVPPPGHARTKSGVARRAAADAVVRAGLKEPPGGGGRHRRPPPPARHGRSRSHFSVTEASRTVPPYADLASRSQSPETTTTSPPPGGEEADRTAPPAKRGAAAAAEEASAAGWFRGGESEPKKKTHARTKSDTSAILGSLFGLGGGSKPAEAEQQSALHSSRSSRNLSGRSPPSRSSSSSSHTDNIVRDEKVYALQSEIIELRIRGEEERKRHRAEVKKLKTQNREMDRQISTLRHDMSTENANLHEYAKLIKEAAPSNVDTQYVLMLQSKLCRALHKMGAMENQLQVVKRSCDEALKGMQEEIAETTEEKCRTEVELMNELMKVGTEKRRIENELAVTVKDLTGAIAALEDEVRELKARGGGGGGKGFGGGDDGGTPGRVTPPPEGGIVGDDDATAEITPCSNGS